MIFNFSGYLTSDFEIKFIPPIIYDSCNGCIALHHQNRILGSVASSCNASVCQFPFVNLYSSRVPFITSIVFLNFIILIIQNYFARIPIPIPMYSPHKRPIASWPHLKLILSERQKLKPYEHYKNCSFHFLYPLILFIKRSENRKHSFNWYAGSNRQFFWNLDFKLLKPK